jgi:hypothetical protein
MEIKKIPISSNKREFHMFFGTPFKMYEVVQTSDGFTQLQKTRQLNFFIVLEKILAMLACFVQNCKSLFCSRFFFENRNLICGSWSYF